MSRRVTGALLAGGAALRRRSRSPRPAARRRSGTEGQAEAAEHRPDHGRRPVGQPAAVPHQDERRDRRQGRHLRQLVRQLLALLPVALDHADRAVRAQPRGAGQPAAHRRLQQARADARQHAAGLAAARGLLHGAHRQVPERLRRDGSGHRGPPGWNEWYGSLDNPDGFTGGTYTAYGYTLNENGQIVHYGSTPGRRRSRRPTRPTSTRRRRPTSSGGGRRADKPFYLSVAPRDPHAEAGLVQLRAATTRAPRPATRAHFAGADAPRGTPTSTRPTSRTSPPTSGTCRCSPRPASDAVDAPLPRPGRGAARRRRPRPERGQHAASSRASSRTRCSSSPPTTASSTASTGCRRGRSACTSPRSGCRS